MAAIVFCFSGMELEVRDIHMNKEGEGVIIYSTGASDDSKHGISSLQEAVNSDSERKEFETKECDIEKAIDIPTICENMKHQQDFPIFITETFMPKEDATFEDQKVTNDDKKMGACGKKATKSAAGNRKTKRTVPQPFALETERRAFSGTRPFGSEFDDATAGDKPVNLSFHLYASLYISVIGLLMFSTNNSQVVSLKRKLIFPIGLVNFVVISKYI